MGTVKLPRELANDIRFSGRWCRRLCRSRRRRLALGGRGFLRDFRLGLRHFDDETGNLLGGLCLSAIEQRDADPA